MHTDGWLAWTRAHWEFFRDKPQEFDIRPPGKIFQSEYAAFIANENVKLGSANQLANLRESLAARIDNVDRTREGTGCRETCLRQPCPVLSPISPPMNPIIEQLLVLQDRDQRIKSHRAQEKAVPTERAALEAKREATKAAFETLRDQSKHNEVERRKLEVEAQTKRDSIAKYRTQQTQTRKNEEFQALIHEIQAAETEIRAIEDRELDLMEAAEKLGVELKAGDAELKHANESIARQLKDLDDKAANLAKRLAELAVERETLASAVDPDTLSLYERILKSKGDVAVVPIEHEICQGCHMKTPGTTVSLVRAGEELVQDPNCGRILYRVI